MSLELVAFRLYAPYFGYSIYVWGSMISVVMLALAAVLELTNSVPLNSAVPPLLVMVALPAVLVSRKPVTPPLVLAMMALPAVAAFVKVKPEDAATTPPLPTLKVGAFEELLTMPAPLEIGPAVTLAMLKV